MMEVWYFPLQCCSAFYWLITLLFTALLCRGNSCRPSKMHASRLTKSLINWRHWNLYSCCGHWLHWQTTSTLHYLSWRSWKEKEVFAAAFVPLPENALAYGAALLVAVIIQEASRYLAFQIHRSITSSAFLWLIAQSLRIEFLPCKR